MLSPEQINEIHRLHLVEKWPQRRIARHLHIGRHTLAKYLDTPAPPPSRRDRTSKLDVFKPAIAELLQQDPKAPEQVLFQRLQTIGYDGGITILKDYLQAVRKNDVLRRAYVRMEPSPGERFDIDWGHFGALSYNGTPRKLYAFCLVECHSRKMYLEFTHSQSFETFVRCHMHAFQTLGGCARELWFDNLATAVAEHDGNLVRFNPRFLAFAREYSFIPRACHVAAAWEKGKVERAIGYVRQNFWPLRSFADLSDVNSQARRWLQDVANRRKHRETGQTPDDRFQPEALRPLPLLTPDYRDSTEALVHKDLRLTFDGTRGDYEKFTSISRAMKQTAVEVTVPVVLVSQTSRSNSRERRADLDVADLRGSGAIEKDAAGVFLLFEDREDAEAARSVDDGRRYTKGPVRSFLKIGKNRYGEQGRCLTLWHHKAETRFEIADSGETDAE
jgi:transposase